MAKRGQSNGTGKYLSYREYLEFKDYLEKRMDMMRDELKEEIARIRTNDLNHIEKKIDRIEVTLAELSFEFRSKFEGIMKYLIKISIALISVGLSAGLGIPKILEWIF